MSRSQSPPERRIIAILLIIMINSGTDGLGAVDLKCTFQGTEVVCGMVDVLEVEANIVVIVRFEVWFEDDMAVIVGSVRLNERDGLSVVRDEVADGRVTVLVEAVDADRRSVEALDGVFIRLT